MLIIHDSSAQSMSKSRKTEHASIKLPESLTDEMDRYIGTSGFTSRAEIAKQAIREFIAKNPLPTPEPYTYRLEKINTDSNGTKILDRELREVIQVYIKPNGITCDHCRVNNCEHVDFALSIPEIKQLIHTKRKDGWNIPNP